MTSIVIYLDNNITNDILDSNSFKIWQLQSEKIWIFVLILVYQFLINESYLE